MSIRNYLTFDGINLKDFGVYINGNQTYNAPGRDREIISVPGRNGDLIIDNGRYENTEVTYHAFIYRDFSANIGGLRNLLLSRTGYVRIEDSYHPDEFRLGIYSGDFKADVVEWLEAGEFDLTFNCKPQRFLKSGEQEILIAHRGVATISKLINETPYTAKPLLYCGVYGTTLIGTVTINGKTLSIDPAGMGKTAYIDCDLMDAYWQGSNMNQYISGDFPELVPGENTIETNDRIRVLEITPRWWRL